MNKKPWKPNNYAKRFWDIIKKPTPKTEELTVTSVNNSSGVITVTSTPNCPNNQVYMIPSGSGISVNTITSSAGVITYSGGIAPQSLYGTTSTNYATWTGINHPTYSLTQDGETLEVTLEEWNLSQKAAFEYIKKQRNYKKDFEDLLK